jgi:hypothetical protein
MKHDQGKSCESLTGNEQVVGLAAFIDQLELYYPIQSQGYVTPHV